jgi:hypothetical protein
MSVVMMFGCKTKQTVSTQYVKVDSVVYSEKLITKYDTIVTPADSTSIKAYFECDSLGNVLIRQLDEEKGKMKISTVFKNNTIEILVSVDSSAIIRQAEERLTAKYNLTKSTNDTIITKKRTYVWYIPFLAGLLVGGYIVYLGRRLLP